MAIVHYQTRSSSARSLPRVVARQREADRLEVFVSTTPPMRGSMPTHVSRRLPERRASSKTPKNLGFAVASNQALRLATGRYMLLLNPDARVEPETIGVMREYIDENPTLAAPPAESSCADGRLDLACRRLFPTPERSFYRMTWLSKLFPRSRRFGQYNLTYLDEWTRPRSTSRAARS